MSDDGTTDVVNTNTLTANVDDLGALAGLGDFDAQTLVLADPDHRVTLTAVDGRVRVEVADAE